MTRIGNDVVDLRDPRCLGKASDERFVERVFTRVEASAIWSAASPDRALWIRWAAKEAAFKIASKLLSSPPPFEHSAFRVSMSPPGDEPAPSRGRVRYRDTNVPFTVEATSERIHVLARHDDGGEPATVVHRAVRLASDPGHAPSSDWKDGVRDRFTDREWSAVHGPASALVRLRARAHLARILGTGERQLQIICDEGPPGRTPPRALLRDEEFPGDLTLSHHGRFLAWAFTVPRGAGRQVSGRA